MTEQDKINHEMQMKLAMQDAKFAAFVEEMKDFKQEMRDRDNQRHAEMAEIRKSVQSIQDSGRNQTIITFLGIAAMVIAVLLK